MTLFIKFFKNFLINFSLIFFSIVLVFASVEIYFYQKSKTIHNPTYVSEPYEAEAAELPNFIAEEAHKKYNSKNYSLEVFEKRNSIKSFSRFEQTPNRHVTNLIRLNHTARNYLDPVTIREKRFYKDDIFFDAHYNLDDRHVRLSRTEPLNQKLKNFIALGCSYTFGVGVNDSETITGHLAQKIKNYNFFNLGVPGGGLTEILDDVYYKDRLTHLNKNGGVVVYYFWQDHFRRYFKNIDLPLADRTYYEIEDGKLVRSQPYAGVITWKNVFTTLAEKSHFLRHINFGQDNFSIENQDKFVNYLSFVQKFYKENYNLDFYVFILDPVNTPSKHFLENLTANKIKYIRHKRLIDRFEQHEITIGGDGHYNPKGLFVYSELTRFNVKKDHPDF